jgi:V-type H+-transporting ATPase subunit C
LHTPVLARCFAPRSDDLAKSCTITEQVVSKIRRQVAEIGGAGGVASLQVDGLAPEVYLTRFKWDEAKFPTRRALNETASKVMEIVGRIEDDLKVCCPAL